MDHYCGPGYAGLYHSITRDPLASLVADNLLYSCLLKNGVADGFVQWSVTAKASLTRGSKGVVAVRIGTKRVHSDLLILPILSLEEHSQETIEPSTGLPTEMCKYILASQPTELFSEKEVEKFRIEWEEFLYKVIVEKENKMNNRWELLNAACTESERTDLAATQRSLATTCGDQHEENEKCCTFYDPQSKPSIVRRRNDQSKIPIVID